MHYLYYTICISFLLLIAYILITVNLILPQQQDVVQHGPEILNTFSLFPPFMLKYVLHILQRCFSNPSVSPFLAVTTTFYTGNRWWESYLYTYAQGLPVVLYCFTNVHTTWEETWVTWNLPVQVNFVFVEIVNCKIEGTPVCAAATSHVTTASIFRCSHEFSTVLIPNRVSVFSFTMTENCGWQRRIDVYHSARNSAVNHFISHWVGNSLSMSSGSCLIIILSRVTNLSNPGQIAVGI